MGHEINFVTVMVTIDRKERGLPNYIAQTISSMLRSGIVINDEKSYELHVFDGGSENTDYIPNKLVVQMARAQIHLAPKRLTPCENVASALEYGSKCGFDWVLFVEDDISVCDKFFSGVSDWLRRHMTDEYRLAAFYAAYDEVLQQYQQKKSSWEYPVEAFYGTQCFAVRSEDAKSISEYLLSDNGHNPGTPSYDMVIKDWSAKYYPNSKNFLASAPCFVQHTGEKSYLFNGDRYHRCQSWQGINWSYA